MSEQDRSRLYAWLCEQADEQVAEYVMSCLPAAPVSDLVTKAHLEAVLSAEFAKFALMLAEQREADRAEQAAQRDADRAGQAAQREADRAEQAAQRKADRKWVTIAAAVIAVEVAAAEAGWLGRLTDLFAAAI